MLDKPTIGKYYFVLYPPLDGVRPMRCDGHTDEGNYVFDYCALGPVLIKPSEVLAPFPLPPPPLSRKKKWYFLWLY